MEPNISTGGTPAPTSQSPLPASPPPASNPSSATGGVGVTPAAGATPQPVPTQTPVSTPAAPQIPADIQARLDGYRAMEGEYNQLRQHAHLIPIGYKAWQTQQQPAAPAAPAQPEHPWGLPQFDQRLLSMVRRDPTTGDLVPLPGAPPGAVLEVEKYQEKLREVQTKLFTDPMSLLGPLIEKKAMEIAEKQFGQQYGQIQQQQTTQQIIQQNSDWLYAKDAQGHPVTQFDPSTGQHKPTLSPYGQQYVQFVRQAVAMGITDPQHQHTVAVQGLTNLVYQQRFQQTQQAAAGQQQQQTFLQTAQQQTAGQQLQNSNPNVVPAPNYPVSLKDKMRAAMDGAGLTDQIVSRQVGGTAAA